MKKETVNVRNATENPCHMCMPMGGILPFKGIERAMVILHGSQGCATYMRRHIAGHFNEPIDVASSSLNEKGTVYGGEGSLKQGLDNVRKLYNPGVIGILTTCLAETIGEDIDRIAANYVDERKPGNLTIVPVSTPGYGGTHFEGYWVTAKTIVGKLAQKTKKHRKINIIIPNISPADIREIKRILHLMDVEYTMFPDFSDTLDRPFEKPYLKIPRGGTKPADISRMPGAPATVEIGITVDDSGSPGKYLEEQYGVPLYRVPIPIGLENTDRFIEVIRKITGTPVPESLELERGRLLDCMIDSHKYNFQGRSVIFGEPELVYAVSATCLENGVFPVVVATGSRNRKLTALLKAKSAACPVEPHIINEADFTQIREMARQKKVNLAIGHSDGRYLTEKEGIPLVRMGFPIHDRVGGQRLLSVGYTGTAMFLDRITNTLLENKYKNYRSSMFEKFYHASNE